MEASDDSKPRLPREHRVIPQEASSQCLSVFSEDSATGKCMTVECLGTRMHACLPATPHPCSGNVRCEGHISQRADVQPKDSDLYMKLKQYGDRVLRPGSTLLYWTAFVVFQTLTLLMLHTDIKSERQRRRGLPST